DLSTDSLGGSEVNLGGQAKPTGDRPSGRDLIAEAVESGEDLVAPPGKKPESKVLKKKKTQHMPASKAGQDEAVDLGAPLASDPAGLVHARAVQAKNHGSELDFDLNERSAEDSSGIDL